MLYFAFGSNMDSVQMQSRVGDVNLSIPAKVSGFRLVFDKYSKTRDCGAANLISTGQATDVVEGVLYKLTKEQFTKLDKHEGIRSKAAIKYEKVIIVLESGIKAVTYIAKADFALKGYTDHKPSFAYMNHLLQAKNHLSKDYYHTLLLTMLNERKTTLEHLAMTVNEQDLEIKHETPNVFLIQKELQRLHVSAVDETEESKSKLQTSTL